MANSVAAERHDNESRLAVCRLRDAHRPERVYPPDAVRGRREGTVYVAALVGKDGEVKYAAVTKGVHESLNRDAVDTIKRCRFKPGRCDGRAVAIWGLDIPMEYKIH